MMDFTDLDRNSATWDRVVAYAGVRIVTLQRELEADKDPVATAKLRGRLAEIRKFLRAGEEPAREVVAGDD